MTAAGKNVYYDVLDDVVNKYNNTKHSTIIKECILMNIMKKIVDFKYFR